MPREALRGETVSLDAVPPYFYAGEQMTWELRISGIVAGRARMATGAATEGTVMVQAQAEVSGLVAMLRDARDEAATWVDVKTGLPARTEAESEMSGRTQRVIAVRSAGESVMTLDVWRRNKEGVEKSELRKQKLPAEKTHDSLSALLLLRGWTGPPGTRAVLYSMGGTRMWRTELLIEGAETIETELGKRKAVRISGIAHRMSAQLTDDKRRPPRHFTFWRSDDDERIPLLVKAETEFGEVIVEATSYTALAR